MENVVQNNNYMSYLAILGKSIWCIKRHKSGMTIASLSTDDNYMGIFNSIAKVLDYVVIEPFGGSLQTTDILLPDEAKHSTTLCTIYFIYLYKIYTALYSQTNVLSCATQ